MALRAKKPEGNPARKSKMLLSGLAGVGKTWAALDFPKAHYIDVEGSATLPHYSKKLLDAGGVYFGLEQGSGDIKTVIEEIKALATEDHDYQTLVIDSFTKLYNNAAAEAEARYGNDFGRDKKEANKPARSLINWISKLDMNVVIICHSKKEYNSDDKSAKPSTTFDGFDKLDYEIDMWLEILSDKKGRKACVRKSRLPQFAQFAEFPWSFPDFAQRFGGEMFAKAVKFVPATKESIGEFQVLFTKVGMGQDWLDKALTANKAASIEEVSDAKVREWIEAFKKKIA